MRNGLATNGPPEHRGPVRAYHCTACTWVSRALYVKCSPGNELRCPEHPELMPRFLRIEEDAR